MVCCSHSWQYVAVDILTLSLTAASQAATMGPVNPGIANPVAPGQDPNKSLTDEAENLQVMDHFCLLDGIEERLLDKEGVL